MANADTDGSNGIFGGVGRDIVGTPSILDFDAATNRARLVFRTLPGNQATAFNLVLTDRDSDTTGDQFQFPVQIAGATPLGNGFSEILVDIREGNSSFTQAAAPNFPNPGDRIANYGLAQFQIQSQFGGTAPLDIEVRRVEIVPIPEPGTLGLLGAGTLLLGRRRRAAH